MCGIIGRFGLADARPFDIRPALKSIHHRGPDASGWVAWNDGTTFARSGTTDPTVFRHSLGHARLSIIDLSHAADQPLVSHDERFILAYNGEVYNYVELRERLISKGVTFRTTSDTEVVLECWRHFGPDILAEFEGMFAFILLDRQTNRVFVARDHFGIKPLYMQYGSGEILLSSEIGPLIQRGAVLNYNSGRVAHTLRWGSDDGRSPTLVSGIERIAPGTCHEIDLDSLNIRQIARFFDLDAIEEQEWSFEEARQALRNEFLASVDRHMRSDAPISFSLSGGIDSSALVCAAHALGRQKIPTFTYLPSDQSISELKWAQIVIQHVGADPQFIEPSGGSVSDRLAFVIRHQGEPFGTLSIFAQNEVYRRVRECGFKVILNGQGADETLAGYMQFFLPLLLDTVRSLHLRNASELVRAMRTQTGLSAMQTLVWLGRALLPNALREQSAQHVMRSSMPWLRRYRGQDGPSAADIYDNPMARRNLKVALKESIRHSLIALLRYDDRNSMSHSVESRVPFLTPNLVKLALSFPDHFLISKSGVTKHIFRESMRGIVPDAILDRRDKVAFAPDNVNWATSVAGMVLDQPLPPMFDELVDRDSLLSLLRGDQAILAGKLNQVWPCLNLYLFDRLNRQAG